MHDADRRMREFERWHRRPAPRSETPTSTDFESLKRTMRDAARRFEGIAEAWESCAAPELRGQCVLSAFGAGVLTVVVPSASVSYALDRALREGLETALREASGGKLVRVRSRVGAGPA